jgi:hypothetical protein
MDKPGSKEGYLYFKVKEKSLEALFWSYRWMTVSNGGLLTYRKKPEKEVRQACCYVFNAK